MSLLRRIEKLESMRGKCHDAALQAAIKAMEHQFTEMTDEELDALIAEGEKEPGDPELDARLARMDDEELCRLILTGELK